MKNKREEKANLITQLFHNLLELDVLFCKI